MCVWLFDPPAKGLPYIQNYPADQVKEVQWALSIIDGKDFCIRVQKAYSKDGELEVQVEHYGEHEKNPHIVMQTYLRRMRLLGNKGLRATYPFQTYILDSFTFAEQSAIEEAKVLNPLNDPNQRFNINWAASAAVEMTGLVFAKLPKWSDVNVIVIAHEGEKEYKKGDVLIRGIHCYGKLIKNIAAAYGEVYHTEVQTKIDLDTLTRMPVSTSRFVLRTKFHDPFDAGSNQGAPDPCEPVWAVTRGEQPSALPEHQVNEVNDGSI